MDPRRFDLHQLLAAFEVTLQQGAKDEADWKRTRGQLYAEPKEVRDERRNAARNGVQQPLRRSGQGRSLEEVEAMLAGFAARDARYGAA